MSPERHHVMPGMKSWHARDDIMASSMGLQGTRMLRFVFFLDFSIYSHHLPSHRLLLLAR